MFLIRLLRWLFGWVRFEAEGGFPERLLNLIAQQKIDVWGVRRNGILLKACCPVREYHCLRSPAHRAGMRMHVIERHGAPFFIRRYHARAGVLVGLVAFALTLHLFSQRIWVIEVRGNNKVDTDTILSVMQEFGVCEGADLSHLDVADLQLEAIKELPDLAWCTVNLNGSMAYVDVMERIPTPELPSGDEPSNIKAKCDGRVLSVEAYSGQAMIQKGDAVAKGMLLVSGVMESNIGPILKRSQARVMAETTHRISVSVPLKESCTIPSGKVLVRPSLHLFSLDIPMYTSGTIEQEHNFSLDRHSLTVNGIHLPIGIVNRRYELLQQTEVVRSEEEAARIASQRLSEKSGVELDGVQIQSSAETGGIQEGNYVLTGEYHCVEDIAVEEKLILE